VHDLMGLLRHYLRAEIAELHANGVRLRIIGERKRLSTDIITLIENGERLTQDNDRLHLTIALSYGGRGEIALAARRLARLVAAGRLSADDIDENAVASQLLTVDMPDPDLIIRTSGEQRISNFLLWQSAYAELVFVDTYWPDFGKADLERAISDFCGRERRYGATVESR
jgi:undecaprenyl diphosphate synthase